MDGSRVYASESYIFIDEEQVRRVKRHTRKLENKGIISRFVGICYKYCMKDLGIWDLYQNN